MTNWSIDLVVVNSLRSKLANKNVKGVFSPVVESLGGVWAFFPPQNYMMPELMKIRHSELPINIMFEEFQALEELQKIAQK